MLYYDRYREITSNGNVLVSPKIKIEERNTDKYITFKKGQTKLFEVSDRFYNSPFFSFIIHAANPNVPSLEPEIENNTLIRIPFPLESAISDYRNSITTFKRENSIV